MSGFEQTKKRHPTGIPPRKKQGGQPRNRNAAKRVLALSTIRVRARALRRRAKALMAMVSDGVLCGATFTTRT